MQKQHVTIKSGFQPQIVYFQQGEPAQLIFHQEATSACLHEVKSQDLNFHLALNQGETQIIPINTDQPGEATFSCGMDMFHGKVIVK